LDGCGEHEKGWDTMVNVDVVTTSIMCLLFALQHDVLTHRMVWMMLSRESIDGIRTRFKFSRRSPHMTDEILERNSVTEQRQQ